MPIDGHSETSPTRGQQRTRENLHRRLAGLCGKAPYIYGNVEFAEGGNLLMEFTDIETGELKVKDAVRFVFRIKDDDRARGFRRYFWKATKA
jgi:uncharacterized OB-fold protein